MFDPFIKQYTLSVIYNPRCVSIWDLLPGSITRTKKNQPGTLTTLPDSQCKQRWNVPRTCPVMWQWKESIYCNHQKLLDPCQSFPLERLCHENAIKSNVILQKRWHHLGMKLDCLECDVNISKLRDKVKASIRITSMRGMVKWLGRAFLIPTKQKKISSFPAYSSSLTIPDKLSFKRVP